MARKKGRRGRTPQPPAAAPPTQPPDQGGGQGGYYEYNPTTESQLNQPYQDLAAAGATGSLADVLGRMGQQGQMADIYGQGAAQNLGGAQQGMNQLTGLGGQYTNASGQNLQGAQQGMGGLQQLGGQTQGLAGQSFGQYGQLMDPNFQIQQGLAQNIQDIQAGKADFDPFLTQQFNDQERVLREQLRRNQGTDFETSSAGIEALGKFGQNKTTALGSAQFNRLNQLVGMQQGGMGNIQGAGLGFGGFGQGVQGQQFGQGIQSGQFGQGIQGQQFGQGAQLGGMFGNQSGQMFDQSQAFRQNQLAGAGQMLNQTGQTQQLYANIPQTMGQFGQAMSGQAGAAVNAQGPYQQDRFGQFQASYAPTQGQYWGQMAGQSGDRWINAAKSMGGGGGMSGGTNQFGGAAGTGQGDPNWSQNADMAGM